MSPELCLLPLDAIKLPLHRLVVLGYLGLLVLEGSLLALQVSFLLLHYCYLFLVEGDGFAVLADLVILVSDLFVDNSVVFGHCAQLCLSICPYFIGRLQGVIQSLVDFLSPKTLTSPRVLV